MLNFDVVLESADYGSLVGECERLCGELDDLKARVQEVKSRIASLGVKLCARFGIEVRKKFPKLYVHINRGSVRVGYKSKFLLFRPDVAGHVWDVEGGDRFVRGFLNSYRKYLLLYSDLGLLVDAVGAHFESSFKTFGEGVGEGAGEGGSLVFVEGSESSLVGVVRWAESLGVEL